MVSAHNILRYFSFSEYGSSGSTTGTYKGNLEAWAKEVSVADAAVQFIAPVLIVGERPVLLR